MSHESHDELDADARSMLDAFAAEERLPSAVHERVWARVADDVEAERRAPWLRRGVAVGLLAAAAVALLWVGVRAMPSSSEPEPSQAGYERAGASTPELAHERQPPHDTRRAAGVSEPASDSSDPAPPEPEPVDDPSSPRTSAASETPSTPVQPKPAARRVADEPAPEAPTPGDDLAEENRLLGQARRALIDERPERALARLGEHERRFPHGVLTEERQALRAVALCEAERSVEGKAAARLFLREHPQAALAHRVRSACLE